MSAADTHLLAGAPEPFRLTLRSFANFTGHFIIAKSTILPAFLLPRGYSQNASHTTDGCE